MLECILILSRSGIECILSVFPSSSQMMLKLPWISRFYNRKHLKPDISQSLKMHTLHYSCFRDSNFSLATHPQISQTIRQSTVKWFKVSEEKKITKEQCVVSVIQSPIMSSHVTRFIYTGLNYNANWNEPYILVKSLFTLNSQKLSVICTRGSPIRV
jgi:hypothetical protein